VALTSQGGSLEGLLHVTPEIFFSALMDGENEEVGQGLSTR